MSYSDFTIEELKARFNLRLAEGDDYFASVAPVAVGALLQETLAENIPLALAISTEKARSELIIVPVLMEVRRQVHHQMSLFSGVDFSVDPERGLKGTCAFLLSQSTEQLAIEAPVVAVVEAKNENMTRGIVQCLAEMIAIRLFNERRGRTLSHVFGVVTTGNIWKFVRLSDTTAHIDVSEYYIKEVGRVVGIICNMVQGAQVLQPEPARSVA